MWGGSCFYVNLLGGRTKAHVCFFVQTVFMCYVRPSYSCGMRLSWAKSVFNFEQVGRTKQWRSLSWRSFPFPRSPNIAVSSRREAHEAPSSVVSRRRSTKSTAATASS